ncbi:MAG: glutamate--tRNA ligase [Alphaproteobacteria bacterium]|nr:glutamate--tRNA ligase [Alphaproteobacteria bacterium]
MTVRVRFAPSPTGYLHSGNARTAIVTWLFCRKHNGHFLLRIDDTDLERSKPEYEEDIEAAMIWLDMSWDEKARQRDRNDRYAELIEKLKAKGRLYACYETADELALKRKTQLSRGLPPLYDRAALKLTDEQKAKFEAEGRRPHWRFKIEDKAVEWNDIVRGPVKFEAKDMSDPVLIREDGSPLYHLCSVIDDIDYNMTHIVRGEDHVSNTAAHIQMFEALDHTPPQFAHLPMISDIEGGKLSKRMGSLSVKDLRENEGLEAMAIISLLAKLGSSDPIEPFTNMQDLINSFDIAKFSKGAPKFDMEELLRLNAKIVHQLSFDDVKVRLANMGLPDLDENFWLAVRPNLTKLTDIKEWWQVANGPVEPVIPDSAFAEAAANLLPPEPWSSTTWKEWTEAVKAQTGRKGKDLFMPLRQALTGMEHGPELGVLLPLIGAEKTLKRLKKAA